MLIRLRAAVENTIERRHAAGAACFARPPLDFDRFFAAIVSPLRGVRPHCSLTQTLPVGLIPIMWHTFADQQDQTLKLDGKRNLTVTDGLQDPIGDGTG
jgi:hypothetical protein